MYKHHVPWHYAKDSDTHYQNYVAKRHTEGYGFQPFDCILEGPRSMLYTLLEPDPVKRVCIADVAASDFMQSIQLCSITHQPDLADAPLSSAIQELKDTDSETSLSVNIMGSSHKDPSTIALAGKPIGEPNTQL